MNLNTIQGENEDDLRASLPEVLIQVRVERGVSPAVSIPTEIAQPDIVARLAEDKAQAGRA